MHSPTKNIDQLLKLANHYPSPHNGQPIRVKILSEDQIELYFDRDRGLRSADISFLFSFVSMGVFIEHFVLSATALGHHTEYVLDLPLEKELRNHGIIKFARCKIEWDSCKPDKDLQKDLIGRQTSRKKYYEGASAELDARIQEIAKNNGMLLNLLDSQHTNKAIWLNQRAVFDDMFDEPVRLELDNWLRYSQREKQAKQDGLAYDCMELSGRVMKYIVRHPAVLHAPLLAGLLQRYYMRTMKDNSSLFYMLAPFLTEKDAFDVGLVIMKIWNEISKDGYYLHPFGTIMSNKGAHQDFLHLAGITDESREDKYLTFIFRCGRSDPPVPSLRKPYKEHLILE